MLNNYLKLNLVFLLFSFALGQSNSNVNGYVRDRSNGEPLGYVNVFIKEVAWVQHLERMDIS